jgi:hypothetical protein
MVITKRAYADPIFGYIRRYGLHVSPDTCESILSSLGQTAERVAQSSQKTRAVLAQLNGKEIVYPKMPEQVAIKYPPSIFVMHLTIPSKHFPNSNPHKAKAQLAQLVTHNGLHYETSFGSAHHRIDSYPKVISLGQRKVLVIRVYVGYDGPIEDLVKFLESL